MLVLFHFFLGTALPTCAKEQRLPSGHSSLMNDQQTLIQRDVERSVGMLMLDVEAKEKEVCEVELMSELMGVIPE